MKTKQVEWCGYVAVVPQEGEPADVYWFGFDTAHGGDIVPGMLRYGGSSHTWPGEAYRDLDYVKQQAVGGGVNAN